MTTAPPLPPKTNSLPTAVQQFATLAAPPPPPKATTHRVEPTVNRKAPDTTVQHAFELLDTFDGDQLVDLAVWMAEHPMPNVDPVRLAMGHVNALKDAELLDFLQQLKAQCGDDIWWLA